MIRFSNGAALETLASFTLDANRGIALNIGGGALSPAANTTLTYGGIIAGTGALTKSGAGTLVLSGTNTYSGTTSVTAGRLDLDGSAANSAFTVNGGTLGGHGTIGALTIGAGGTLAPGDSPGTLFAGNTTWAGGGNYVWEINNATGVAGTNYDLLSISGSLTVNATSANPFTITLSSLTPSDLAGDVINFNSAANYTYIIASTTTGVIGFSADKFTLNTAGFTNLDPGAWSLNTAGNNLILLYAGAAAIPEPSTYAALAGLAALALAAWRRHSRRRLG
jgi:autotransporter-associated beta strand protein